MTTHVSIWDGSEDYTLEETLRLPPTNSTLYGVTFFDSSPKLSNYWVGKTDVQLYTYLLTLVTGGSKQAEPLTTVDTSLVAVTNNKGYFSYSLGEVYEKQGKAVVDAISIRQVGTLLFAPVYNLQKATARPRIWSLSLVPLREDGKWGLHAQAIMGHCSVWPMLPYELLGAVALCQLIVGATGIPLRSVQWMFHSLTLPEKWDTNWVSSTGAAPDRLPSEAVAGELLAAEAKLRKQPSVRPMLRIPVDAYGTAYLDKLQNAYKGAAT